MESVVTKSLITAALVLVMIISGVILRKNGEPYNTWIFTLHKLMVAAITVFMVLIYIQHFKLFSFQGLGMTLFLISGLTFLAAFVSGALLSFEKTASFKLQLIHRISSWVVVLFIPVIWIVCH